MARKSKVSGLSVVFHLVMTLVTGGIWLVGILIWWMLTNGRR